MYIYKGRDIETFQIIKEKFQTLDEAQSFASRHKHNHSNQAIESILNPIIDGINIDNEVEELDDAYDEDAELDRMGLKDEETSEGFDWTFEDKG